ncbi:MAG TPA: exopolysaccharide biosynthesis polyprenyl glycosylphosphotransferase [Candidatus Dormibacteraeota bacterium]|nr:exopolysaccharide biosynthesis polyprenyl glycosylphosphotransferase [Candidatus Dormibacteraeota bacterium]
MIETTAVAARTGALPLQRRRGLLLSERRLLLVLADVVAVAVAYVAAFNIRTAVARDAGFYIPRSGTVIAVAMWLVMAQLSDAYNLRTAARIRTTMRAVGTTLVFSTAGLLVLFFAMPYRITRPTILLWVPLSAALVTGARLLYRRTLTNTRLAQPIALLATSDVLQRIWPDVREQSASFYRVQKVINPLSAGAERQLDELASSGRVGEVILGMRDDISRELFGALVRCYDSGMRVRSLADLYEELTGRLLLDQLGHSWLISLPMRSETSRLYAACKRGVDVVAGLVGTVALLPLLLLAAPLIKLTDGGPVLHRQTRVGKYGRHFQLTKLRTMRVAGDGDTRWTETRDPRITAIGRALRRLHLDELPQSWNILRGDMSLIGPRPEQPQYVDELEREVDFYRTRLTVRPGLTGWAQVNYGYGSGSGGARVKLSYDLYYIKRQSVALDLVIVARTLLAVLSLGGR